MDSENIFLDEGSLQKYEQLVKEHDKNLINIFKKFKVRYKKIYTDDNVVSKLFELIKDR